MDKVEVPGRLIRLIFCTYGRAGRGATKTSDGGDDDAAQQASLRTDGCI